MTTVTTVGILETGKEPDALAHKHGDFPRMFMNYFAAVPALEFSVFHVSDGEPLPAVTAMDAWLITGSPAGVYENHPWIKPLENFVQQALAAQHPTLGICFGHQLMAQALGGTVVKSDKGRGIGIHEYALTDAGKKAFPSLPQLQLVVAHQDQVIVPPENATVLAHSAFCPYAVLAYGSAGLSIQAHPEFTVPAARDITASWQEASPIADDLMAAAEATFATHTPNADSLAPLLAQFLRQSTNKGTGIE